MPSKKRQKYSPIGVNKDGERMCPPAAKITQRETGMFESPQMRKPEPYKRPGSKTDS